ncbi:MAG: thiol reductant ABC exporter subunit CydC [Bifidobacteriaceae bacterium]|jgi:thiol reductant ABC exporter CydC subunit|nr:thiol reductant ABC exporter subunit CydC [Bifidobacteriaceae bacterium]
MSRRHTAAQAKDRDATNGGGQGAPDQSAGELTPGQIRRRLLRLARPIMAPLGMSVLFRTAGLVAGIALLAVAGWAVLGAAPGAAMNPAGGAGPAGPGGPGASGLPSPDEFGAGPVIITLIWLSLVKGLARYLEQYCGHYVAFRILAHLRLYFYDRLAPQAPAAVEGRDTGDLLSRVTKDVDRVEVFFAHTIAPAVTAVIVPAGTVIFAALTLDLPVALTLAVGLALVGLATPALGRQASAGAAARLRESRGHLASHVRDSVQGVREVLAFGRQDWRLEEMEQAGQGLAGGLKTLGRANGDRRGANVVIMGLTLIGELLLVTAGDFGPAQAGLALGLSVAAFAPVLGVEDFAADLQQAYASARRIFEVTDSAPLVPDRTATEGPAEGESPRLAKLSAPEVRFESVSFGYPAAPRNSPALSDVSLVAPGGQVTAIVGASGSGKSTLAALLTRSWDPDGGTIKLGGRALDQYSLDQLRAEVSVSSQRPYLFNLSIEENLRLARPGVTATELDRAAAAAHLDAVIAERESGWDAPVGEMGELLSGGQRQRLALARALVRDPSVLVLDEATSQLDHAGEAQVLRGLEEAWRGKTVIVIAHRLATVRDAAKIYVMDAGRVVQEGSYPELASSPGPFADLLAREDQ